MLLRVLNRSSRRFLSELRRVSDKLALWRAIGELRWKARNPKTFNEKIWYKAAYDRRPILTLFADKIKVRDYVSDRVGDKYLAQAYAIAYDVEAIDWTKIPRQYVAKANHGSGCNLIVWDHADPTFILNMPANQSPWKTFRVTPQNASREWVVSRMKFWLTRDYYRSKRGNRVPEWPYRDITPGIIIEELLLDSENQIPADYKLHMFNGKCQYINVLHRSRSKADAGHERNYSNLFTPDWTPLDLVMNGNPRFAEKLAKPDNLAEMLWLSEKLADGIDYVRVDLYNLNGRLVFGELTSLPSAGKNTFVPASEDAVWGSKLKLDDY